MTLKFLALPTETVRALQAGASDANGQLPERKISDGSGKPCRHCLRDIPAGEPMLVLAYQPFSVLQPYAEVGPIFLCAEDCERHADSVDLPDMFRRREAMLVRAYDAHERIHYGTGQVVTTGELPVVVESLLERPETAYVHLRSAA